MILVVFVPKYQQQIEYNVMNLKIKLQPSPRSRHARKPLFCVPQGDIKQNIQTSSLDRLKNNKKNEELLFHSIQKQKSSKPRQSDKQNRPQNSQINRNNEVNGQKNCKNHLTRKAVHYIQRNSKQFYCFECSLHEARKGTKMKVIKNNKAESLKMNRRQNELQLYLQKSEQMEKCYKESMGYCNQILRQYKREWQNTMKIEEKKLESFIAKAVDRHKYLANQINKFYKSEMEEIEKYCRGIEEKYKILAYNKIDIHKNYQECLSEFKDQQYRYVMDKYWDKINIANQSIHQTQQLKKFIDLDSLNKKLSAIISSIESPNRRKQKQFTFSKSNRYETPEQQKTNELKNVEIIQSTQFQSLLKKRNRKEEGWKINSFSCLST